MDRTSELDAVGIFDARYKTFLETVAQLRPRLHRYCARMTGSVMDGEDIIQEALFEAYRKLDRFDDSRPLTPWLLRIAHNRCIDFLRARRVRADAESAAAEADIILPIEPAGLGVDRALERLVANLPPKERACMLLKDVFEYSLEEIADLVDSTPGGVKAALSRGRAKLAADQGAMAMNGALAPTTAPEAARLLQLYIERFNRRDWDGLRDLISADARLRVSNYFAGRLADSFFFSVFQRKTIPWRLALGRVDGAAVALQFEQSHASWAVVAATRVAIDGGKIVGLRHYVECPWVLAAAVSWGLDPLFQA